jgi:hypothetical protein
MVEPEGDPLVQKHGTEYDKDGSEKEPAGIQPDFPWRIQTASPARFGITTTLDR